MLGSKTMRVFLLFLCGLKCLVQSTSNCTLKLIKDGIERTDFSCIEYSVPAEDCRVANNPNLPIVDNDSEAIGSAENFHSEVDRLIQNVSEVIWNLPRLHLSWNLPEAPSSYKKLQGFMVDGVCVTGGCPAADFCTVFQLTGPGFESHDWKVQFKYEKVLNISSTFYHLKLFALPRTLTDGRLVKHHYRNINGFTNNGPTKNSVEWSTSPKLQIDENNVTISFKYPEFNFTVFNITLKDKNHYTKDSREFKRLHGSTHVEVTFYNIPAGEYFIDIVPIDQFAYDFSGNCQCYKLSDGSKRCDRCRYVQIQNFNITASAEPTTTSLPPSSTPPPIIVNPSSHSTDSTDQTTDERSESWSNEPAITDPSPAKTLSPNDDNKLTIGLAVGLTTIFALGAAVLLYYMLKCRKRGDEDSASLQEKSLSGQFKEIAIEEKTVFVLSADDNQHHLEAVKQLVMFLQDKCQCRVIYPPWEIKQIGSDSWRGWLHKSLDKADYVLIVNSEASYNLLKASTGNKSYRYKVLTDSAHLFHDVLNEILKEYKQPESVHSSVQTTAPASGADRLDIDKFLTVSFYYTPKEYYLTDFCINFELLQQLPNFIRYIHKLQPNNHIPLGLKDVFTDVPESDCKADLESAVSKAGRFQKSDVLWFSERFGDAYRRETERHDSGYDEQDEISRSRTASQKSQEETDEFGFFPPSNYGDGESRVTAPDVPETISYSNFSFIPPDAVSRGVSEFLAPTESQDDSCTISRQLRNINKNYEDSSRV